MSVQDIIYITPQEFKLHKEHTTQCEKISGSYAKLLSEYDCFTKPDLVMLKFPASTKTPNHKLSTFSAPHERPRYGDRKQSSYSSFKHGYGRQTNHGGHVVSSVSISKVRPPLKALSKTAANSSKLKGLLNIINKTNYPKVSHKVQQMVSSGTVEMIIDTVLDTACCQVFYIDIFYRLIMDVLEAADENMAETIKQRIYTFIEVFIRDALFVYHQDMDTSESQYMQFCLLQKHKCLATSRNLVILELLRNAHSTKWSVQSYLDHLLDCVSSLAASANGTNKIHVEQNIDTILCMIRDIKQRCKDVHVKYDIYTSVVEHGIGSKRMQFMIQDIMRG